MAFDPGTHQLFEDSNIDGYDGDRWSPALRAGLEQHGLELRDVLAVTAGYHVWAICAVGIFQASLQGVFKKRIEVGSLIPWSEVTALREEPSTHKTMRIVLMGDSKELARMDFDAGGMENTPEIAAAHRGRIYRVIERARANAR